VVNPPAWPLTQAEMDPRLRPALHAAAASKLRPRANPSVRGVKDSIQIARGCFGGCAFCSITVHEGRTIQSRSPESILAEIGRMTENPTFPGVISDLGGPTANMYGMNCSRPEMREKMSAAELPAAVDLSHAGDRSQAASLELLDARAGACRA